VTAIVDGVDSLMEEPVVEALGAVRAFVAGREPLGDTLGQVSHLAVRALAADVAGLTLLYPDGRARTAVATADIARVVDQAQYDADRGPCLHAFREGATTRVDDTELDERWPEFAARALEEGVRSSLSLPLLTDGQGIGALNLYSAHPRHFSDEDETQGAIFAAEASVALANAQAYWEQAERAEGLAAAMQSRAVIEQAKGVIIATTGVDEEEAFEILRQQSQFQNRKLREIAVDIVRAQQRAMRPPTQNG
jgi:GAF domain-containing protein